MGEQLDPIGIAPKRIRDMQRMSEISLAIMRFSDAGKSIPQEWVDEYNALSKSVKEV